MAKVLGICLWWLLFVYLTLGYVAGPVMGSFSGADGALDGLRFSRVVVGWLALLVVFLLIQASFGKLTSKKVPQGGSGSPGAEGAQDESPQSDASDSGSPSKELEQSFPTPATVLVDVWLLVLTAVLVVALYAAMNPDWLRERPKNAILAMRSNGLDLALVTMLAAGVGAMITTILGYLRHASVDRDFKVSYVPWYFARPLLGILLGLVFYLLLRGGLFLTLNEAVHPDDLSVWGFAGLGALVGLFSKNAIEKLRELFHTLFVSRESVEQQIIDSLSKDVAEKVKAELAAQKKSP